MKSLAFALSALALLTAAPARAEEAPQNLVLDERPKPLPNVHFRVEKGKSLGLLDLRGKVVVLNLRATWCIPCRKEMPTLDRLQAELGGPTFEVVALSIDRRGMKAVDPFFREIGITHLARYLDTGGGAAGQLGVFGLPTTILIDREGRELGRLVGPAEWDRADMIEFLRKVITRKPAS